MTDLAVTLLPLAIGSAVVPIHILITVLLLRRPAGRVAAASWAVGLASTRLVQGVVFGLVLTPAYESASDPGAARLILPSVLLVLAVALLAMAVRAAVQEPDEDAPPPAWMTMLDTVGSGRAFLMGAGIVAIGPKFWVFTLGAIAAIEEAGLGLGAGIATYLLFVLIAMSIHLALLLVAFAAPVRSEATLARLFGFLTGYGRPIKVGLGLVFGLWFLVQALDGLGVR